LVIARLNRAVNEVLNEEKTAAAREEHDGGRTPQEARAFFREETERWTEVIRGAKIKFLQ
jgi:hypothetical protein